MVKLFGSWLLGPLCLALFGLQATAPDRAAERDEAAALDNAARNEGDRGVLSPNETRFPFRESGDRGKWGYCDRRGKIVIPSQFEKAYDFSDGLAMVHKGGKVCYINQQGEVVCQPPEGFAASSAFFSEGLAVFDDGGRRSGRSGYFDREGRIVISPQYDDARSFSEGMALVNIGAVPDDGPVGGCVGGRWGFIDKTGRQVVRPKFAWADSFSEGLAVVRIQRGYAYIDKTGSTVFTIERESKNGWIEAAGRFSEGLARVGIGTPDSAVRWGFVDKTGKFVIRLPNGIPGDFSEGLARIYVDGRYSYINRLGRIVIPTQFDEARTFSEGLAAVALDGAWGYMDKQGNVRISPKPKLGEKRRPFNDAEDFSSGLARVHTGGQLHMVRDGFPYWSGGAWYYINRKGEIVRRVRLDDESGPGYGKEAP